MPEMSTTSDTVVPQQGRTTTTTRTPASNMSHHHMNNFQAHALNSQNTLDYASPPPSTPPRMAPADLNGYTSNDGPSVAPNSSVKTKKTRRGPKHVVTSPSAPRNIRATPPLNGAQSAGLPKTGKTPMAYAGPTFHASPAPSALPLPSFLSKSVPESPAPIVMNSAKDETETSSNGSSDSPTPPTAQLNGAQNQREESPLDFFFMADRAERARAHRLSSGTGPFQPPFESPPPSHTPTNPSRNTPSSLSGRRPSSMFAMEMDSPSVRKPMGAPFATPYNERIKAARSNSSQAQTLRNSPQPSPPVRTKSDELRDYLFHGPTLSSTASAPAVPTLSSSSMRSASGPSTPVGGPQVSRHPIRPYNNDFPHGNAPVSYNSPRTISRSSGLRQEVPQNKTPIKKPDISERVTSAPPKMSTYLPSVNNGWVQDINRRISSPFSTPSAPPPNSTSSPLSNGGLASQRSRSEIDEMEDRLREHLKMSPAKKPYDNSFSYGSPASAHRMNNGVGGYQS